MKKYNIIEGIILILSICFYILFLVLNKGKSEYYYFKSSVYILGYILPCIHIAIILIKQIFIKSYIGLKYDSIMAYFIVILSCLLSICIRNFISEDVFNKASFAFWILEPLFYIFCIISGIILEKKDKKKLEQKRIQVNK